MKTLFQTIVHHDGNMVKLLSMLKLDAMRNLSTVYATDEKFRKAVMYIAWAYSADSPAVTSGTSWQVCKERAAEQAGLSEEMINELVNFEFKYVPQPKKVSKSKDDVQEIEDKEEKLVAKDDNVRKIIAAINEYLDAQNDKIIKHLRRMDDLYEQLSTAAVSMMNNNGVIDYQQKIQCQKGANDLFEQREAWEKKLEARNENLQPAMKEITAVTKKVKSLRPELV